MNYIKITDCAYYLPKRKVLNSEIEKKLNLEEGYILKEQELKKDIMLKTKQLRTWP